MYSGLRGPSFSQTTSDLEVMDDVVSSFGESLEFVLENNFEPPKHVDNDPDSESSSTKNKRLAAIFARQWLSGVLTTLSHKLEQNSTKDSQRPTISVPSEPEFVEDQPGIQNIDDLSVEVEMAKVSGDGQIEVNYDVLEAETPRQLKPKLRAKELMKVVLQGKSYEWDLHKKLDNFWKTSPGLLLQVLTREQEPEGLKEADGDEKGVKFSVDKESLDLLEKVLEKDDEAEGNLEDYLENNPRLLIEKGNELGLVGVDRLVELFKKLKKQVLHVNKSAKFFVKFARDNSLC